MFLCHHKKRHTLFNYLPDFFPLDNTFTKCPIMSVFEFLGIFLMKSLLYSSGIFLYLYKLIFYWGSFWWVIWICNLILSFYAVFIILKIIIYVFLEDYFWDFDPVWYSYNIYLDGCLKYLLIILTYRRSIQLTFYPSTDECKLFFSFSLEIYST